MRAFGLIRAIRRERELRDELIKALEADDLSPGEERFNAILALTRSYIKLAGRLRDNRSQGDQDLGL